MTYCSGKSVRPYHPVCLFIMCNYIGGSFFWVYKATFPSLPYFWCFWCLIGNLACVFVTTWNSAYLSFTVITFVCFQILETIPISDEVSDLVQKLGNFYTDGEREEGEAEDHEVDSRPFTRPFANHAGSVPNQPCRDESRIPSMESTAARVIR